MERLKRLENVLDCSYTGMYTCSYGIIRGNSYSFYKF